MYPIGKFNIEVQSVDRYNLNNLYLKTTRGPGGDKDSKSQYPIRIRFSGIPKRLEFHGIGRIPPLVPPPPQKRLEPFNPTNLLDCLN